MWSHGRERFGGLAFTEREGASQFDSLWIHFPSPFECRGHKVDDHQRCVHESHIVRLLVVYTTKFGPSRAFVVFFGFGSVFNNGKTFNNFVLPVRGS